MRAIYLTGERVYLRAMIEADKEVATAWWPGPYLVNAARAEEWLKETHKGDVWGKPRWYALCRTEGDAVVGSACLAPRHGRRATLMFHMAPSLAWDEADSLRADALRLVVPWVRDDLEYMVLTLLCGADETATVATARELGMVENARLPEFIARPGRRVDQLWMEALNAPWRVADATETEAHNG